MSKNFEIFLCAVSLLAGITLLIIGVLTPPAGVIDSSLLIAWGETLTFIGSVIGIDYSYRKGTK